MRVRVETPAKGTPLSMRIDLEIEPAALEVRETYLGCQVRLEDWLPCGEIGGPALPGKTLWVALPQKTCATGVTIENAERVRVTETPVRPAPLQPRRLDIRNIPADPRRPNVVRPRRTPLAKPPYFSPGPALYNREQTRPQPPAWLAETRLVGDVSVALISIKPVSWTPSGHLELIRRLQFKVSLDPMPKAAPQEIRSEARPDVFSASQKSRVVDLARAIVVNPGDIASSVASLQFDREPRIDYLIITDNQTWDPTFAKPLTPVPGDVVTAFNSLANWRSQRGQEAKVVTISDIMAGKYGDFGSVPNALMTPKGNYITVLDGGRSGDTIHTNAVALGPWEQIRLVPLGGDVYALRTQGGHYLTAVDGGGRNHDVIHTDATAIGPWEKFTFIHQGHGQFALRTDNGHYLTAVNGGGRNADSVHTDATAVGPNEQFMLVCGPYALMTDNGHYVTAVDGGDKITDAIHTDATALGPDEKFVLVSLGADQYALRTIKGFYLSALDGGGRTPAVIQTDKNSIGAFEKFRLVDLGSGKCALRAADGHYLTAVGGGGRTRDVMHTDAVNLGPWETFTRIAQGNNKYAIRTIDGHYLTAVDGGGRMEEAIKSDSPTIGDSEVFTFNPQGGDLYALQTAKGQYLSAVGGGGRNGDVLHTNATTIGPWETFNLVLQPSGQRGLRCSNGLNLQAIDAGGWNADAVRTDVPYIQTWESFTLVPVDIDDLQSILRKFVRWAHDNWGTSYVLLGGDTTIVPIRFVQANGPFGMSGIATDFYYSSLFKRIVGTRLPYEWSNDQSVEYFSDVSVGRAPVASGIHACTFVSKVTAYETMHAPGGTAIPADWKRRLLFAASSWGRDRQGWDKQLDVFPSNLNPPPQNSYYHQSGTTLSLIQLSDILSGGQNLLVQISDSDIRSIPYQKDASASKRGWFFALDPSAATNPTPSIDGSGHPVPTHWAAVYSTPQELDNARWFTFDPASREGSMSDEEALRKQVAAEIPGWNLVSRLYCDESDLTPDERAAAEVEHISVSGMRDKLNQGQHAVSLSGHGASYGVLWEPDPALAGIDFYLSDSLACSLSNAFMPSIVFADSCDTNHFIGPSISKDLVLRQNGGAVAYVGHMNSVQIGVGKEYQKTFFHGLAVSNTLGVAHDARLATFGVGMSDSEVRYHILNMSMLGDPGMRVWKRGLPSGVTPVGDLALGKAADGRLEIFARGNDGHVWHLWQTKPNGDWSAWENLSAYPKGVAVAGDPAVGKAADGRLEIFARGIDNRVWHLWQTKPNGDWSQWENLSAYPQGVAVAGTPAVGKAADGHLEIFTRGNDNRVWHLWQTKPNGDWFQWEDIDQQ